MWGSARQRPCCLISVEQDNLVQIPLSFRLKYPVYHPMFAAVAENNK